MKIDKAKRNALIKVLNNNPPLAKNGRLDWPGIWRANPGLQAAVGGDTKKGYMRLSVFVSGLRREGLVPRSKKAASAGPMTRQQILARNRKYAADHRARLKQADGQAQPPHAANGAAPVEQLPPPPAVPQVHECPRCHLAYFEAPADPHFNAIFSEALQTALRIAVKHSHRT